VGADGDLDDPRRGLADRRRDQGGEGRALALRLLKENDETEAALEQRGGEESARA
jgi:hypothetical protein